MASLIFFMVNMFDSWFLGFGFWFLVPKWSESLIPLPFRESSKINASAAGLLIFGMRVSVS